MGSFADKIVIGKIPEEKRLDYEKDMLTLIKQSGMMSLKYVQLFDEELLMIFGKKPWIT